MKQNSILLIDGSFYLYRSYFGIPKKNQNGQQVNAIYGVLHAIKTLLIRYNLKKAVVVFDYKGKTFRNKLFKQYKANRLKMPEALSSQIKLLHKIIKFLGLPILQIKGVEADDVIGTLAIQANSPVLIATGDKDMLQLVTSKIKLIDTIHNSIFGPKEIKIQYGFSPRLIVDFIALMGDRCDNIPGIPGIGKKTAQILVSKMGSIKNIYNNLNKITSLDFKNFQSIVKKLKANKEIAFMSYKLATINTDITINFTNNQIFINEPNEQELFKIFKKYQFISWFTCLKKHGKNFLFKN